MSYQIEMMQLYYTHSPEVEAPVAATFDGGVKSITCKNTPADVAHAVMALNMTESDGDLHIHIFVSLGNSFVTVSIYAD